MWFSGDLVSRIPDIHLRRAAELALRALGDTDPNPPVGCVIVGADGAVVGEGWHQRAGGPHAEVHALEMAGRSARGATAYVTLEPCAHHGLTPPCADALIEAGVARVVIGMPDPGDASGGGAQRLRDAGIAVGFSDDPTPFEELVAPWRKWVTTGLPYVVLKQGMSLDGATSVDGSRRIAVTGASGRQVTLGLRARTGAVLVGSRTVKIDDPTLLREEGAAYPATRVVLCDWSLPPSDAKLMSDAAAPTIVLAPQELLVAAQEIAADGVRVVGYDRSSGLEGALRSLGAARISSLLVEAGPRLFEAFMSEGLIDELVTVVSGGLLGEASGGRQTLSTVRGDGLYAAFDPRATTIVGDVVVTSWTPRAEGE